MSFVKKILLSILLISGVLAHAQLIGPLFPNAEEINKLKDGKLIVALMDTTGKSLLAKEYNNNLMYAMKNRWTLCPYEFAPIASVIEMKDNSGDNVYFMVPTETETYNYNAKPFARDAFYTLLSYITIGKAKDLKVKKKLFGNNYAVLYNKPVLQSITSSYDFIAVNTAIKELQDRALYVTGTKEEKSAANAKLRVGSDLRNKTLLIDKGLLKKDMTEANLKMIYHYPVKIVSSDEILTAIRNKENDKAFLQTEPMSDKKDIDFLYAKSCSDLNYMVVILTDRGVVISEKKLREINELVSRDKK